MKESTRESHRETIRSMLAWIRRHLDGDLSLEQLAERAAMAPHHFHRVFRRMTGRGVAEHVRSMRLVRAALELRNTARPITDIAFDAGYENVESFSRAFKRAAGRSPREYRKALAASRRGKEETMQDQNPGFGLVKIPVSDFARATAFYREVLGLSEAFAVEAYGWAQYDCGGMPLCLYVQGQGGGDGTPGGDTGIHLLVDRAEALFETLTERGADLPGGMSKGDDGSVFFTVRDPDGNALRVMQRQG